MHRRHHRSLSSLWLVFDCEILNFFPHTHTETVLKILDKCGLFEENLMKRENVFVTLHDAVITAEKLVNGGGSDDSDSYASRPGYPGFDALLL